MLGIFSVDVAIPCLYTIDHSIDQFKVRLHDPGLSGKCNRGARSGNIPVDHPRPKAGRRDDVDARCDGAKACVDWRV